MLGFRKLGEVSYQIGLIKKKVYEENNLKRKKLSQAVGLAVAG